MTRSRRRVLSSSGPHWAISWGLHRTTAVSGGQPSAELKARTLQHHQPDHGPGNSIRRTNVGAVPHAQLRELRWGWCPSGPRTRGPATAARAGAGTGLAACGAGAEALAAPGGRRAVGPRDLVRDGLVGGLMGTVLFSTTAGRQKARNLARDPRVSITVFAAGSAIAGGTCQRVLHG
ncbi:MAG TPA: pyridoxamine 5'-phosphate oxidase family protein [Actinomycetes bacterium]|nr:pyridoxamine 5'-phosphate oxidase family protein [Actinomycetes bacterium]